MSANVKPFHGAPPGSPALVRHDSSGPAARFGMSPCSSRGTAGFVPRRLAVTRREHPGCGSRRANSPNTDAHAAQRLTRRDPLVPIDEVAGAHDLRVERRADVLGVYLVMGEVPRFRDLPPAVADRLDECVRQVPDAPSIRYCGKRRSAERAAVGVSSTIPSEPRFVPGCPGNALQASSDCRFRAVRLAAVV